MSPSVSYESDGDADVDPETENDFYDFEVDVKDDDFYYVSWKDPIYDYKGKLIARDGQKDRRTDG